MQITLTPVRQEVPLTLSRSGDVLTMNGTGFDFGAVPDGGTSPRAGFACPWLAADPARVAGVLQLVLILPHGGNAPPETRWPAPLTLTTDGAVALPVYDIPE